MGKNKRRTSGGGSSSQDTHPTQTEKATVSTISPDTAQKLEFGLYDKTHIVQPLIETDKDKWGKNKGKQRESSYSPTTGFSDISKLKLNWKSKVLTFSYFLVLMAFGLSIGAIGLSISPLSKLTDTAIPQMGWLFTHRGLGSIIGSVLGGYLFHFAYTKSIQASNFLLAGSVFTTALILALVPGVTNFSALAALYFAYGITGGIITMGCNLLSLWLWQSTSVILGLNSFAGMGSFVAPLLFWSNGFNFRSMSYAMTSLLVSSGVLLSLSTLVTYASSSKGYWSAWFKRKGEYRSLDEMSPSAPEDEEAATTLSDSNQPLTPTSPVIHGASSSSNREEDMHLEEEQEEELAGETLEIEKKKHKSFGQWFGSWMLAYLQGSSMFGAVALESTFGGLLATYIRAKGLARNYGEIAMINSAFWLSLTLTRLLMAPLGKKIRPGLILALSMGGVLSGIGYFLLGPFHPSTAWLGSIVIGSSLASLYPLALSYPQAAIPGYGLSAKMSTLIMTMASSAEAIIPIIVTSSFLVYGANALFRVLLGVALINSISYAGLLTWAYGIKSGKLSIGEGKFAEEHESLLNAVPSPTSPVSPVNETAKYTSADELLLQRTPGTPA